MDKDNNSNNNKITKILFVCLGNICRSPAAEGIMRQLVEERHLAHLFTIDSAGIGNWHQGQLPDHRMRRHGQRHGYLFDHRARQLCRDDFQRFDLLVGMDEENLNAMARLAPDKTSRNKIILMARFLRHHPQYKTVPDPYYGGDSDFETVIALLEDACEGLLDHLTNHRPQSK